MVEYEAKCQEVDSYRQKCSMLEQQLRRMSETAENDEQEKLAIIESYERKIVDYKQQISEQREQQKQLQLASLSTQADEEIKTNNNGGAGDQAVEQDAASEMEPQHQQLKKVQ